MLNVEIDRISRDLRIESEKIDSIWSGDVDKYGSRIVPFEKIIGQVSARYALKILTRIYDPTGEALRVRYSLANRRVFSGKFSAFDILNTDADRYGKFINLARDASRVLTSDVDEEMIRSNLLKLREKLSDPSRINATGYEFSGPACNILDVVLSDTPRKFQGYPNISGSGYVCYLDRLYEASIGLFISYQRRALNFCDKNPHNPKGFTSGILYTIEENKLRTKRWEFERDMNSYYSEIIEQDLTAIFRKSR